MFENFSIVPFLNHRFIKGAIITVAALCYGSVSTKNDAASAPQQ
jgi:hypothetical protein